MILGLYRGATRTSRRCHSDEEYLSFVRAAEVVVRGFGKVDVTDGKNGEGGVLRPAGLSMPASVASAGVVHALAVSRAVVVAVAFSLAYCAARCVEEKESKQLREG